MIVLTEVQNVRRFASSQQFTSNLGLVPSEHSTGDTRHRGHITKTGNRHIRGILVECAWTWIRYDKAAYAIYRRLARRREPKRAIVAMARRLRRPDTFDAL
jgi:transposase